MQGTWKRVPSKAPGHTSADRGEEQENMMQRLKITLAVAVLAAATLALATAASGTKTPPAWTPHTPSAAGPLARIVGLAHGPSGKPFKPGGFPSIAVGSFPVGVGIDTARHTVYVANPGDGTVSVVDGATCNAGHTSGCDQTPPTVSVGNLSLFAAVDEQSHTVYVDNLFDNTISMIDTATCNAADHSGCGNTPPTVSVGSFPVNPAVDIATNTIYVPNNGDNTVSVIDGATCNSTDTSGCAHTHTIAVGSGPTALAIDQATNTIYVPNTNDNTVSVINGATCNGQVSSGCGQTPATIGGVGNSPIGPTAVAVDEASDTVYVTEPVNDNFGTLAIINGATCNGTNHSGCGQTPATTPVGAGPIWVTDSPDTHTVYVLNQEDSDLTVIDTTTCNATTTAGCLATPATLAMGFEGGAVEVDPTNDTIYATSQGTFSVSVLDGDKCSGSHTAGCTRFAPTTTVGAGPQGIAADQATDTVYVGNRDGNDGTLSVIDATRCNAATASSCSGGWPTVATGAGPQAVAVNERTDTVYTANAGQFLNGGHTVSVIDGASCNAHITSGCGKAPATVDVGNNPFDVAVNEATDTIYVANNADNTVSVINGATCNGTNHAGCGQIPATVAVGARPSALAVDESTDTIYVANANDNTVSVIDGATCNGQVSSGCGQTPATIAVGDFPDGLAIDAATHTLYVENRRSNFPFVVGSVSLVDTAACNAAITSGCSQAPPTVAVGGAPFGITIDPARNDVYVNSLADADVAVIDGNACNATNPKGCHPDTIPVRMGGFGGSIAIDQAAHTAYVPNDGDANVSFFRLGH